jgi:hypothetical protein
VFRPKIDGLPPNDDGAGLREGLEDRLDFIRAELLLDSVGGMSSWSENTN